MTETHSESPRLSSHVIQCRLPIDLYEWLRLRAFQGRRSMNSVTFAALADYRAAFAAGEVALGKEPDDGADTTKYTVRAADDLYEWLRETAFYARVSMNSVVVVALRRSRAAHHADEAAPPSLEQTGHATKEDR